MEEAFSYFLSDSLNSPRYSLMERVLSLSALKVGTNAFNLLSLNSVAVRTFLKSEGAAISDESLKDEIFFRLLGMWKALVEIIILRQLFLVESVPIKLASASVLCPARFVIICSSLRPERIAIVLPNKVSWGVVLLVWKLGKPPEITSFLACPDLTSEIATANLSPASPSSLFSSESDKGLTPPPSAITALAGSWFFDGLNRWWRS